MQKKPLVSIICLCYNHEKYVVESLDSVMNQSYDNIEIILVDDCSQDNSVKEIENWLKKHPKVLFSKNKTNIGNTKTFNSVFQYSKGKYIVDLATDDILFPNTIELQVSSFEKSKNRKLGIVYGNLERIDNENNHIDYFFNVDENLKTIKPQPTGDIYKGLLSIENNVCSVSSMVKRDVYETLNCYDTTLYYEDLDFWIRAARQYEFEYIDEILVKKRVLSGSLSDKRFKRFNSKTRKFNQSTYLIILKALNLNQTNDENKAILKFIYHELRVSVKTIDIWLFLKYIALLIKLIFTIQLSPLFFQIHH